MAISVTEPLNRAIERTKDILFRPFNFNKWCGLGFCAFLAGLGAGGGGVNVVNPQRFNRQIVNDGVHWFNENLSLILIIGGSIILFALIIGIVVSWIESRGQFMFIDGIVKNSSAIGEPWREYKKEGNSLFKFKLCLLAIGWFLVLIAAAIVIFVLKSRSFDGIGIVLFLALGLLAVLISILLGIVGFVVTSLVVPTMYKRRVLFNEAWSIVKSSFGPHTKPIVLYALFQILIVMGIGTSAAIVTLLLCCIPAIPYVGAVILLPLSVFFRAYQLYYLEQFGPEWKFFSDSPNDSPSAPIEVSAITV